VSAGLPRRAGLLASVIGLLVLMITVHTFAADKADLVVVYKAERQLSLMKEGRELECFSIVLGAEPVGHKQEEGVERTPEGDYVLDAIWRGIHWPQGWPPTGPV